MMSKEHRPYPDELSLSEGMLSAEPAPSSGRNKTGKRNKKLEQRRYNAQGKRYRARLLETHNRLTAQAWAARPTDGKPYLMLAVHLVNRIPTIVSRETIINQDGKARRVVEFFTYTEALLRPDLSPLVARAHQA
jgi:hypothetical protein